MSSTPPELKSWPALYAFWIFHKLCGFSLHILTFFVLFPTKGCLSCFWTWVYLYCFLPLDLIYYCPVFGAVWVIKAILPKSCTHVLCLLCCVSKARILICALHFIRPYFLEHFVSIIILPLSGLIGSFFSPGSFHSLDKQTEIALVLLFKTPKTLLRLHILLQLLSIFFAPLLLFIPKLLERVLYIHGLPFLIPYSPLNSFHSGTTPETAF